jgi:uncharacterized protein YndB with AHSA1/START domain
MDKTKVTKDLENKILIIERVFDAPKEKLWQAYANKEMFEKWWGPEGWETTVKEFDFKPGGRIHYGMKCVDESQGEWFGQVSWGIMQFETMNEPDSFAAFDNFSDESGAVNEQMPTLKYTVEFVNEAGQTRLISRSIADTVDQLEEMVKMGMVEGFSSQLNKLETLLAE